MSQTVFFIWNRFTEFTHHRLKSMAYMDRLRCKLPSLVLGKILIIDTRKRHITTIRYIITSYSNSLTNNIITTYNTRRYPNRHNIRRKSIINGFPKRSYRPRTKSLPSRRRLGPSLQTLSLLTLGQRSTSYFSKRLVENPCNSDCQHCIPPRLFLFSFGRWTVDFVFGIG